MRKENARSGKRKAIIESDDEEDQKKNDNGAANPDADAQQEEAKESQPKEKIIKAPQTQQITNILLQYNISLAQNKNAIGGRKAEDTKVEATKKMVVRRQTGALFLQNNELRALTGPHGGLSSILEAVMWNSHNLLWLDLSYNFLTQIEDELLEFPELKTLYLHGNYIGSLEHTKKL